LHTVTVQTVAGGAIDGYGFRAGNKTEPLVVVNTDLPTNNSTARRAAVIDARVAIEVAINASLRASLSARRRRIGTRRRYLSSDKMLEKKEKEREK